MHEFEAEAPPPELAGEVNPGLDFASRWLNTGGRVSPFLVYR
jgi:hypothetical protein